MPSPSGAPTISHYSSRSPPSRSPRILRSSAPRVPRGPGPPAQRGVWRCGSRGSNRLSCSPRRKWPALSCSGARPTRKFGAMPSCWRRASPLPRGGWKVSAPPGPTRPCANFFPAGPRCSANCKAPRPRPCSRGPDGCSFRRRSCSRGIISGDAIRSRSSS